MADDKKHVKVTLIWGGTGASKTEEAKLTDTAKTVFDDIYKKFNQKPTDQDTFEVDEKSFEKSQFGTTVEALLATYGANLVFEVIPPTSGA